MVYRVHIDPRVVGSGWFLLFFPVIGDDLPGVPDGALLDVVRAGEDPALAGDDLFDAIGEVFPLLFRNGKVGPQVEDHPLPRPPFGPHRLDEFEGVVLLPVLVGVGYFPDIHGTILPWRDRIVNTCNYYFGTTNHISGLLHL